MLWSVPRDTLCCLCPTSTAVCLSLSLYTLWLPCDGPSAILGPPSWLSVPHFTHWIWISALLEIKPRLLSLCFSPSVHFILICVCEWCASVLRLVLASDGKYIYFMYFMYIYFMALYFIYIYPFFATSQFILLLHYNSIGNMVLFTSTAVIW